MSSIARVGFASTVLLILAVTPAMAQWRGGRGFHGGMMGGGFHGGMMGPHGFRDDHFHNGHFHDHDFFPWWGFAPFSYGAFPYAYSYPYPYPVYPYPYYVGYSYGSPAYY